MADIAQAFSNYGTPEQRERAQQVASFHSSIKDSDASVSDSSWQTVPAMQMQSAQQASAVQQPRSPIQNVAYQQAVAVQQPGMPVMAETQVAQKVIDPRMAAKEEAANLEAISAQRAQFQAEEEQSRIRAIGYDKLSKEMEAKQADFNNLMTELKSQKLTDPQEKWGTAGKIGAAISMALGAFAAAYTGGRNYAADIIDGAIKRDIDMQEAQIRKLGTDAQGAQNALATAYRKLGDMAQARNAVEMAAIANVGDDIMKRAEKSDNDKVKANAQLAVASLKQKEAQRASAQNEMTIATMGRPAGKNMDAMALETPYGTAPSTSAANIVREQAMQIGEARTGLTAATEYISKHGSFTLMPSAAKGEYQATLVPVKRAYQVLLNLGVLNPSEDEKMDSLIKNKLSKDEAISFINGLNKMVQTKETELQKAYIIRGTSKQSDFNKLNSSVDYKQ